MARTTRLSISVLGLVLLILVAVSPAYAATIEELTVTCDRVIISGRTEVRAPFVRVQVALASNLTDVLAKKVVPVWFTFGAEYRATLNFSGHDVADGTLLVISAGEWNGFRYLRPATLVSAVCSGGEGSTPTPTPFDLTPTPPTFEPPTYTPTPPTFPPPTYTPTAYVPPPTSTPINVTPAPTRTPLPPPTLTRTPLPPPTLTRTPLPPPTLTRTPFMPTPTQIIVTPSPPYTPTPLPTYTPPS